MTTIVVNYRGRFLLEPFRDLCQIGRVKITSDFAILDVKKGRKALLKSVGNHKHKVPVIIWGFIVGGWSGDDNTSIEFEVDVVSLKTGKPIARKCACVRCTSIEQRGK
jgi:hypothetical protein